MQICTEAGIFEFTALQISTLHIDQPVLYINNGLAKASAVLRCPLELSGDAVADVIRDYNEFLRGVGGNITALCLKAQPIEPGLVFLTPWNDYHKAQAKGVERFRLVQSCNNPWTLNVHSRLN